MADATNLRSINELLSLVAALLSEHYESRVVGKAQLLSLEDARFLSQSYSVEHEHVKSAMRSLDAVAIEEGAHALLDALCSLSSRPTPRSRVEADTVAFQRDLLIVGLLLISQQISSNVLPGSLDAALRLPVSEMTTLYLSHTAHTIALVTARLIALSILDGNVVVKQLPVTDASLVQHFLHIEHTKASSHALSVIAHSICVQPSNRS